jgi:hypothetical protein
MAQWAKYRAQLRGNLCAQPDKTPIGFFLCLAHFRAPTVLQQQLNCPAPEL